jgi:hypothetical protein
LTFSTGVGIPAPNIPRKFDPFVLLRERMAPGLVSGWREIVDRLGGSILA